MNLEEIKEAIKKSLEIDMEITNSISQLNSEDQKDLSKWLRAWQEEATKMKMKQLQRVVMEKMNEMFEFNEDKKKKLEELFADTEVAKAP